LTPEGDADRPLADRLAAELAAVLEGPADDHQVAARRLGQAMRAVIDLMTATTASNDVLIEAAEKISEVADLLTGQGSNRRYEGLAEASGLGHDSAFFDWSPQLGLSNPLAPPIFVEIQDGIVVGRVSFGSAYEGPPGCVHGGSIAAAFDEILGLTQSLSGQVGMTGTLTVRYRQPTPLHTDLSFEGRLDGVSGRKVLASSKLYAGEDLTAEATGLFVTITPERFRALSANRER
jgi:acyl-coenzyme A thioesterase PaaI-like protein